MSVRHATARLAALRRLFGMAWRTDKASTSRVVTLIVAEVVSDGLVSLSLRWIVNGALGGRAVEAVTAAVVGGLALAVGQVGGRIAGNLQMELAERVRIVLDREVLTLSTSLEGVEHLERPDHLDRILLVRQQSRSLAEFAWSALGAASLVARLVVSLWLLLSVHPALLVLAALFVVPLSLARSGRRRTQQALTDTASPLRLEKHLHDLCVKPGPAKEIRIAGSGPELDGRAARLWREVTATQLRARGYAAVLGAAGWLVFAVGYAAALLLVTWLALHGRASAGDIVLVTSVVTQFRGQTSGMAAVTGKFVTGMHVLDQYQWLLDYAAARRPASTGTPVPDRLRDGIVLDGIGFRYPGTDREVLHGVDVRLPAGSVVALVGEHGAGKTTLVKLLCGLYRPTVGRFVIDGVPLDSLSAAEWRTRTSAAFQDFGRYEFAARETVGVGDLPNIDDDPSIHRALDRAGAVDLVTTLPNGLDTQLGRSFSDGVDLSTGQWQKLALGRAFMRGRPLLLVLDEPTASLDVAAEQELFERYAERAGRLGAEVGAITLLVSHRFATVRMADVILVLADGTITRQGTHADLMRAGGLYADLYRLQADAYKVAEP
ncbi:MAG TPA: ABC transporter ATP-binding protein [Pseudonocardiaceae bacterium]